MSRYPLLAIGLVICSFTTSCDLPGRPDPNDRPIPASEITDFAVLYEKNCAGCHGSDGKFGPAPPLNDDLFRAIVPKEMVMKVLAEGRHKTLMPAFSKEHGGGLTDAQISVLVMQIKGIPYVVKKWDSGNSLMVESDSSGIVPEWGKPPGSKDAPAYLVNDNKENQGHINAGAKIFARACASCHGKDGKADGLAINEPTFLALISDQALRRIIITGRTDLGMPNYADKEGRASDFKPLTSDEITKLVGFIANWRQTEAADE